MKKVKLFSGWKSTVADGSLKIILKNENYQSRAYTLCRCSPKKNFDLITEPLKVGQNYMLAFEHGLQFGCWASIFHLLTGLPVVKLI